MGVEGQTRDFRDLATEAKENQQMDENLKKIITEVQELSDTKTENDDMSDVIWDNFNDSLKATEKQIKTIIKELGKLEKTHKGNDTVLKQIQELTALLEWKIDGDKQRESFNNFSGMIPDKINRLKEDLSRQDKRNIENFIKGDGNKNAVLETYLKMIWVGNMPDHTTSRDQRIFDEIKTQIEAKYNESDRAQRELDTKVFTGIQVFADYIQNNTEWNWNTDPSQAYIDQMCSWTHMYNADQFKAKFNEKNNERIASNNEKIWQIVITDKFDINTVKKITWEGGSVTLEFTKEGSDPVTITKEDFMETIGIQINAPEWTVFANGELEAAINGKKEDWFNQIVVAAGEKPAPEQPEAPAIEQLEEDSIKETKMRWRPPVELGTVVAAVNEAIGKLSGIENEWERENTKAKIEEVINALKNPWTLDGRRRQSGIKTLQENMQSDLNLSPALIPDWKFGPKTLYAMKNYIWAEVSNKDTLQYEVSRWRLSRRQWRIYDAYLNDDTNTLTNEWITCNEWEDPYEAVREQLDTSSSARRKEILGIVENKNFPWKKTIDDLVKDPEHKNLKSVQLQLVPDYKWHIDGLIGPLTVNAIYDYVNRNDKWNDEWSNNEDISKISNSILRLDDNWNEATWRSITKVIDKDNKHAYFMDGKDFTYSLEGWNTLKVTVWNEEYSYSNSSLTKTGDNNWSYNSNDPDHTTLHDNIVFVQQKLIQEVANAAYQTMQA